MKHPRRFRLPDVRRCCSYTCGIAEEPDESHGFVVEGFEGQAHDNRARDMQTEIENDDPTTQRPYNRKPIPTCAWLCRIICLGLGL